MSASVRLEDEAFSDERYEDLATFAGLADSDHARGKMARLWRQCTLEGTYKLENHLVSRVLGSGGVDALVRARLGERVGETHVRIRGTKGRIEWLENLRVNGRKGGRPKGKRSKPSGFQVGNPSGFDVANPSGFQELNPPAPAPALKKKERLSPSAPPPDPSLREAIDAFDSYYRDTHGGEKPGWNATTAKMVKTLVASIGLESFVSRVEFLRSAPRDLWPKTPWDLRTFIQHHAKCVAAEFVGEWREPIA